MDKFDAAWIGGFDCVFAVAVYVRTLNLDGATHLIPSALIFGEYSAWVFALFFRKRPGRRKLVHQILAGAMVGAAIGLLATGNLQASALGLVQGGIADFVADLWVPYVQLP